MYIYTLYIYMYSIIEDTGNVQSFSDVVLASGDPARTADTWKPRSTNYEDGW